VSDPIWSADGSRILYRLGPTVQRQSPLGTTREQIGTGLAYPDAASPDGRWLIAGKPGPNGGFTLLLMAADGRGEPQVIAGGPFNADEGSFSPDDGHSTS
jgi:Tol biopolymer transport system component